MASDVGSGARSVWQVGDIVGAMSETQRVKSLTVRFAAWPGHRAGQHVDVRLTAEDGYQAVRSYSIASPPENRDVVLTVERLDDGEVSPYLVDEVRPGDMLEFRGPIGGYFVWDVSQGGPVLLVGGGSGIVPLMAMIRHRLAAGSDVSMRLLYSARSPDDVIYRGELDGLNGSGIEVIYTYTRVQPSGWTGYSRRVDAAMLAEVAPSPVDRLAGSNPRLAGSNPQPLIYICGPTNFVETAANALLAQGHAATHIKTERFGPTGR
jgi:ferredoxin-NADP reductase